MMVGQNDHVQKILKDQWLGKIAFDSDHEGLWGDVCFGSAFVSFKIMQQRVFGFFSLSLQDKFFDELNVLNLTFRITQIGYGFNSKHGQAFTAYSRHFLAL